MARTMVAVNTEMKDLYQYAIIEVKTKKTGVTLVKEDRIQKIINEDKIIMDAEARIGQHVLSTYPELCEADDYIMRQKKIIERIKIE